MKITLKQKKLKDGRFSLYLEYYKGSSTNVDGKRIHLREFEYLKMYLFSEPKDKFEKQKNTETLEFAENVLAIRKTEYLQGKYNLKNTTKSKRTFLAFFEVVQKYNGMEDQRGFLEVLLPSAQPWQKNQS